MHNLQQTLKNQVAYYRRLSGLTYYLGSGVVKNQPIISPTESSEFSLHYGPFIYSHASEEKTTSIHASRNIPKS